MFGQDTTAPRTTFCHSICLLHTTDPLDSEHTREQFKQGVKIYCKFLKIRFIPGVIFKKLTTNSCLSNQAWISCSEQEINRKVSSSQRRPNVLQSQELHRRYITWTWNGQAKGCDKHRKKSLRFYFGLGFIRESHKIHFTGVKQKRFVGSNLECKRHWDKISIK